MKIERPSDIESSDYVKLLIYGQYGTGKTTLACTAPNPIFGLTEVSRSARRIRAMEKTLGKEILIAQIKTKDDVDEFIKLCRGAKTRRTVVFDSMTDYINILKNSVAKRRSPEAKLESVALTMQDWGYFQTATERIIRDLVDLPHDVIILAHHKEYVKTKGEAISRKIVPGFSGDTVPAFVGKFFHAVGFTYVEHDDKGNAKYRVAFQAEDIATKIDDGLRPVEVPNVQLWFDNISKAYSEGKHSFDASEVDTTKEEPPEARDVGAVNKK